MAGDASSSEIPLPRSWSEQVRSALLHVISVARLAVGGTRGWAANSANARVRLKAQLDEANEEIALLEEALRIEDVRMQRLEPHRRLHNRAAQRLVILEPRAAGAGPERRPHGGS